MSDRVVVVTGSAGGVGRAVVGRWLAEGASVLAADAHDRSHRALVDELHAPERLATFAGDLSTSEGAEAMVRAATDALGVPDTLIHLAGGFAMADTTSPDAVEVWQRMMKVNLETAFHCFRAMVPALRSRGGGWIVGMSSRAVLAPPAGMAAYAAAKSGLVALAHSMSQELRSENIHVNLIVASTIDTPANRAAMGEKHAAAWVSPDDVAETTLYLCSERARSVYGATLELYAKA